MTKVRLGKKAIFFFDPTTKKKVLPGQIVEFTESELLSIRTKMAIGGGHLVVLDEFVDNSPVDLKAKFISILEKGDKAALMKAFKKDELVDLAKELGFDVEDTDTKEILVDSIIEDLSTN